jgi:HEAT repeat protein
MDEQDLVQQLGSKATRIAAMRRLVGGVGATELRRARLTEPAFEALTAGLRDTNPKIRWWCIQLLDHVPEPRATTAIAELLDDPVPRVRRNAAHALGCVACKPTWPGELPAHITDNLERLATTDTNAKVRAEARRALTCRT